MTPHERYRSYFSHRIEHTALNAPMCATCAHYVEHYYINGTGRLGHLDEGHCTTPRIKTRMPFDLCTYYEPKGGCANAQNRAGIHDQRSG